MTARRVYLRGVGAYTPLGTRWPRTLAALAEGKSAVRPISHFDASGFPCQSAAAIPTAIEVEDRRLPFAQSAAREAWAAAGLEVAPERLGVFIGAESGRPSLATVIALSRAAGGGTSFDHRSFGLRASAHVKSAEVISPSAVASILAGEVGAGGPVMTVSLACASSAAAIAEAARSIRLGECDAALCGGVGADVDPFMLAGFALLGALSASGRSHPFDCRRDGFVLGEGAAMAVLAAEPPASGAAIEVAGIGRTLDAHHLTAPDPSGDGAFRAMQLALRDAGLESVDYVQAHGTSTPLNDAIEAAAIRRVLGPGLARARVSSVKGALGHSIAGAGALGFLCAVAALSEGTVLPTAGLEQPDRACDLPHVLGEAISASIDTAMCNAFAFGGANVSIVARRA